MSFLRNNGFHHVDEERGKSLSTEDIHSMAIDIIGNVVNYASPEYYRDFYRDDYPDDIPEEEWYLCDAQYFISVFFADEEFEAVEIDALKCFLDN